MQWQWQWSLELCQRWQPQTSARGNVIFMESWTTWYTCGATLHCTGHAKENSNCNAAGDPDSSRKQISSSARFQAKYPEYDSECYIAAGSNIDLSADTDGDEVPKDGYNNGRARITVVTFLHKRVFHPKALVVNWHKPREKKALEHIAHERVLWLDVMTHEEARISILNIHQAAARRPDLQRRVKTHIQAEMNRSEGRRSIMGGDLNAATSRTGYSISTKSHFEKVDNQFQEFIQRTGL
jgi:hypothetical protein